MGVSKHEYPLCLSGGVLLTLLFSGFCAGDSFYLLNGVDMLSAGLCLSPLCLLLLPIAGDVRKQNGKGRLRITVTDLLLSLYLIYILLNRHMLPDKAAMMEYTSLVMLYLYFRNLKLSVLFFLLLLLVALGMWQAVVTLKDFPANKGMFHNVGMFGCFLSILFVLIAGATACLHNAKQKTAAYTSMAVLVLLTVQIVALKSRTAWIASVAGLTVQVISWKVQRIKDCLSRIYLRSRLAITGCAVLCIILLSVMTFALYRFKKPSADGRLLMWTVACSIFGQKPVFGNGTDSFNLLYMDAQAAYFKEYPDSEYALLADETSPPCNEYIRVAAEEGVAGLSLALVSIYFLLFGTKLRHEENTVPEAALFFTIKAAFAVLLVVAMFTSAFSLYPFKVLGVLFAASLSARTSVVYRKSLCRTAHRVLVISLVIAMAVLSAYAISQAVSYRKSVHRWHDASASRIYTLDEKAEIYTGLYPSLQTDAAFLYDYGCILRANGDFRKAADMLEQAANICSSYSLNLELGVTYRELGDHNGAIERWQQASRMIPSRFAPLYHIIRLEHELGQTDIARRHALEFLKKKVKIEDPEIDFMKYEINRMFNFKKQ